MREIRQSGSEGGEAKAFPTPIECFHRRRIQDLDIRHDPVLQPAHLCRDCF